MSESKQSREFLQGIPELLILRLLDDREMYGYELVQSIKLRSASKFQFAEGVIYPLLHSLQNRRLLAIRREKVNGRPRVYYRLTAAGRRQLAERSSQWKQVTDTVQAILDGTPNDSPSLS